MNDKEFVWEVGPWGFAVTGVAMLGIFFSRLADGLDVLRSAGYTFFALLLVPFIWLGAGRYASYWLTKYSRKQIVRSGFVFFWALFTAKLFFLGWSQSVSTVSMFVAAVCVLFSGYAATRAFQRVSSGQIKPLHDTTLLPWLLHPLLVIALVVLFLT